MIGTNNNDQRSSTEPFAGIARTDIVEIAVPYHHEIYRLIIDSRRRYPSSLKNIIKLIILNDLRFILA